MAAAGVAAAQAQTGIAVSQMTSTDQVLANFMQQYNVPGGTFAIARQGKLIYARGFGEADLAGTEPVQPYHLFRIASVSKPITAIAIMKLVQDGQLSLSEKAFGPSGILNSPYYSTIADNRTLNITVQQLLEHSGGWNRNTSGDPMFQPVTIANALGIPAPAPDSAVIKYMLNRSLDFTPGTQYQYSNLGFNVLGRIIEKKTGMTYADYVQSAILEPLGIYDVQLGKNLLEDRLEREGEYVDFPGAALAVSCYGDGQQVPWPYGGFNVEAMDAHGGWIATARDLTRLLVAVDGFNTKPDILSSSTIQTMVTPSATFANYAKGWEVNTFNNWWHSGSLPGTTSIWVRTSGGFTWAAILNTRPGNNGPNLNLALDNVMWNAISGISNWPTHDLFGWPSQGPDANLQFFDIHDTSAVVTFTPGNGERRILIAREGAPVDRFPLDGQTYTANNRFGLGQDLGGGNFVMFDGTASAMPLWKLEAGKTYFFRLFEYNRNAGTGNHALYLLGQSGYGRLTTTGATGIGPDLLRSLRVYPNPARTEVAVEFEPAQAGAWTLSLLDLAGKVLESRTVLTASGLRSERFDVQRYPAGLYQLQLRAPGGSRQTLRISVQ
ncbi:MAG: serine hydrolase [Bacteroidia bacterium]|nr:serine hydrolase [Bacteroidia bacterium]